MINEIELVASGISQLETEEDSLKVSNNISLDQIVTALEKEGWKAGDFDSNGWDWDFWCPMSKGDVRVVISGSGYYGTYKSITLEEV